MFGSVDELLGRIGPDERVLDVGGWACPFNRADWVLDSQPYETRGFYGTIGLPASQGGEYERFTSATWVQQDICDKQPWPFEDKFFDFSICSHTLEDIRDPLYVCSELIRVSKRGYIEVPSRVIESTRGQEHKRFAGLSHHRWLVDIRGNHIQFTMKYHALHGNYRFSFPPSYARSLSGREMISQLYWHDTFSFSESQINGVGSVYEELSSFVEARYKYSRGRTAIEWCRSQIDRGVNFVRRQIEPR